MDLPMLSFRNRKQARARRTARLGGFNEAFYLWANPDVATRGLDPLHHFLEHGWREGRDPCESFSVAGYLQHNPDVAAAGINPLVHFWDRGLAEGRTGWQVERP